MKTYLQTKTDRVNLSQAIPIEKPFTIIIEPICLCNFKCEHCYYDYPDIREKMPYGKMSDEAFEKILVDLQEWCKNGSKIKVIRIIGFGEPLLHKSVGKWVKMIREAGVAERIEITTNGSMLTEDVANELVDAGLDYIRFSIYATNQEMFKKVTRSKLDMHIIEENIKCLQKIKSEKNVECPFVYIKMLENVDQDINKAFFNIFGEMADEIALEKRHSWLVGNSDGRKICPQPFKMLFVRWNGECCACDPDYANNTVVGNAITESIKEVWNGDRLYQFRKLQIEGRRCENESCKHCSFLNKDYVFDDIDDIDISCLDRGK